MGTEAFCILYWVHHGGQVSPKGLPIFQPNSAVRGNCPDPTDCYRCPIMQQEIAKHAPGTALWICPACLKEAVAVAKAKGIWFKLTGHYTEGQCQFIHCTRPARREGDEELGPGYSRLLQLFIGDVNT